MVPAGKSGGSQTNLSAENLKLIKNNFITNQLNWWNKIQLF